MTQMESEYAYSETSEYSHDEDGSHHYRAASSDSAIETSPSEVFWSQSISPTLERRMDKYVYKDGRRCLIENTLNDESLQYINQLEFAWGMKRGTLNLDTRSNVFCVSAKFAALWEDYKWILLPEDHILDRYYTAVTRGQDFPDIGEGPYKYRFVTHSEMKSVAIHRQIILPDKGGEGPKPEHFMFSSFPFQNLGTLTSHVHPRYAICHIAVRKPLLTFMLLREFTENNQDVTPSILRCIEILGIWSAPSDGKYSAKYNAFCETTIDSKITHSDTSDRTASRRLRPHMSDTRLIKRWGYVYVEEEDGIVRLRHKEDAPHLLTANKLRIFEKQLNSGRTTKARWKAIQSWRSAVSGNEEEGQIDDSFKNNDPCSVPYASDAVKVEI